MALAFGLFLLGLFALYWVVRFAVAHGTRDALREDIVTRAELSASRADRL